MNKEELKREFVEFYNSEAIKDIIPEHDVSAIFEWFWKHLEQRDNEPVEFFRWLHQTNKVAINKKLFRKHIDAVFQDYKNLKKTGLQHSPT